MAAYPSTLPAPLAIDYQVMPIDQTIRTDMEVGAARVRRRTKYRMWTLTMSWFFTDAEASIFTSWLQDDIDGGAAWWTAQLRTGDGGATGVEARFLQPVQLKYQPPGQWTVTAQVEARLGGD
jgi:hypothetical protein